MPARAKYLMIASMDVDPEHEAIFNEVYDKEHVPNLSKVPGVRDAIVEGGDSVTALPLEAF